MAEPEPPSETVIAAAPAQVLGPFRTAVLRGLVAFLAPLLTVVILVWIWQTLKYYVLEPVTLVARDALVRTLADISDEPPEGSTPSPDEPDVWLQGEERYHKLGELWLPEDVYRRAVAFSPLGEPPRTARDAYRRWVEAAYLQPWFTIPVFLTVFLALMYLIGSLFAADLARILWSLFEYLVRRVPLVRTVYVPVKQVVDYFLSQEQPRFSRVVAVEYPRRGIWTMAFVTGEGLADVERITGEPMLTILFPTCPVPVTGNTKIVPRREVIDLNVSVEQAAQYILSYGVVINELAAKQGALLPSLEAADERLEAGG